MLVSELIKKLEDIEETNGDVEVGCIGFIDNRSIGIPIGGAVYNKNLRAACVVLL